MYREQSIQILIWRRHSWDEQLFKWRILGHSSPVVSVRRTMAPLPAVCAPLPGCHAARHDGAGGEPQGRGRGLAGASTPHHGTQALALQRCQERAGSAGSRLCRLEYPCPSSHRPRRYASCTSCSLHGPVCSIIQPCAGVDVESVCRQIGAIKHPQSECHSASSWTPQSCSAIWSTIQTARISRTASALGSSPSFADRAKK